MSGALPLEAARLVSRSHEAHNAPVYTTCQQPGNARLSYGY